MFDHGQNIHQWIEAQRAFTKEDRAALLELIHVRTVGDLQTVLGLGELNMTLAAKVANALGLVELRAEAAVKRGVSSERQVSPKADTGATTRPDDDIR